MAELKFLFEVVRNCLYQSDLGPLRDKTIDFSSSKQLAETMAHLQEDAQERRIKENAGQYPDDDFSCVARSVSDSLHTKSKVHLRRLEPLTPVAARFGAKFLSEWQGSSRCLQCLPPVERSRPTV
jgi:hypothetical protein